MHDNQILSVLAFLESVLDHLGNKHKVNCPRPFGLRSYKTGEFNHDSPPHFQFALKLLVIPFFMWICVSVIYLWREKRKKRSYSSDKQLHHRLFRRPVEMRLTRGTRPWRTPAADFVFYSTRHVFASERFLRDRANKSSKIAHSVTPRLFGMLLVVSIFLREEQIGCCCSSWGRCDQR